MSDIFSAMNESSALVEDFMHRHHDAFYKEPSLLTVEGAVKNIFDAFGYSLFAGGKRLRPFLTLTFCALCGNEKETALSYAAAIEMIHTFSLIHDDLPCMDNDTLRRGKPTNHMVYGEDTALLAGDALSLYAFEALTDNDFSPMQNLRAVKLLASSAGICGMIAGQTIDMYAETHDANEALLTVLQQKKTGCLFECACLSGLIAGNVSESDKRYAAAKDYASHIGLAFQITDDILDVEGDTSSLGKSTGSDEQNGKTTFVTLLGLENAKRKAKEEIQSAVSSLDVFPDGEQKQLLVELASFIIHRKN